RKCRGDVGAGGQRRLQRLVGRIDGKDLHIVSRLQDRQFVDSFLFETGRPVLMIPYIISQQKPIKRVLIAWNGSKEAARATFDEL
ncbi:hypothetical protein ACC706_37270, partial [Rhizobium johnstonii]